MVRAQHSDDMTKVAVDIFAHYYITGRNAVAIRLIVSENASNRNDSDGVSGGGLSLH